MMNLIFLFSCFIVLLTVPLTAAQYGFDPDYCGWCNPSYDYDCRVTCHGGYNPFDSQQQHAAPFDYSQCNACHPRDSQCWNECVRAVETPVSQQSSQSAAQQQGAVLGKNTETQSAANVNATQTDGQYASQSSTNQTAAAADSQLTDASPSDASAFGGEYGPPHGDYGHGPSYEPSYGMRPRGRYPPMRYPPPYYDDVYNRNKNRNENENYNNNYNTNNFYNRYHHPYGSGGQGGDYNGYGYGGDYYGYGGGYRDMNHRENDNVQTIVRIRNQPQTAASGQTPPRPPRPMGRTGAAGQRSAASQANSAETAEGENGGEQ